MVNQKHLTDFGIPDVSVYGRMPLQNINKELIRLEELKKEDMEKVSQPETVDMQEKGNIVSGEFVLIEESAIYPDSYVIKFRHENKLKICFVNKIGRSLFEDNNIKPGDLFILEHSGKAKTADGRNEYHTYELHIKRKKNT